MAAKTPLHFTVDAFPERSSIKEESGLLWGVVVQPLNASENAAINTEAKNIARCNNCFAFINPLCAAQSNWWRCSLCETKNWISSAPKRFQTSSRMLLPEMKQSLIEYDLPLYSLGVDDESTIFQQRERERIVHLAIVDETGSKEFMNLLNTSILAALEALGDDSWFGLITYSDRIGIYNLHSDVPHVQYVSVQDTGECQVSLQSLFSSEDMLVQVGPNRKRIAAAVNSLRGREFPQLRAMGTAVQEIVHLIAAQSEKSIVSTRCLIFIHQIPNYGHGSLDIKRFKSASHSADASLLPSTTFYAELAKRSAAIGVYFDLFIVTELEYVDAASLYPLSSETGGNFLVYSSLDDATLPQDLYRQLSDDHAFRCLLRLRTSSGFRLSNENVYGHLYADHQYENMWHIPGCTSRKAFAFDFEYSSSSGLAEQMPTIQMTFAYTALRRVDGSFRSVRRIRVFTTQVEVARSAKKMLESVRLCNTMLLLTRKIIRVSTQAGITEARALLIDWLVILVARYNQAVNYNREIPELLDLDFRRLGLLHGLVRLVFGLLHSDMLQLTEVHPDIRIYNHGIYSAAIDPSYVCRALYPVLYGFLSPDKVKSVEMPLSKHAIETSGCTIFVLDSYTRIYVYYLIVEEDTRSFPPPHGTLLRRIVNDCQDNNHVAPRLRFMKQGSPEARFFDALLLDDHAYKGFSYKEFLEKVHCAALNEMGLN